MKKISLLFVVFGLAIMTQVSYAADPTVVDSTLLRFAGLVQQCYSYSHYDCTTIVLDINQTMDPDSSTSVAQGIFEAIAVLEYNEEVSSQYHIQRLLLFEDWSYNNFDDSSYSSSSGTSSEMTKEPISDRLLIRLSRSRKNLATPNSFGYNGTRVRVDDVRYATNGSYKVVCYKARIAEKETIDFDKPHLAEYYRCRVEKTSKD